MKTTEKENFLLIENEGDDLTNFASDLTRHHSDFKDQNIVVNLKSASNVASKELLSFLELSNVHRNDNKSFVLVTDAVGIDELPEELVVVPTLQEAEDMIQMDEIQRDLGF